MREKVLVTGTAGFIGFHMVARLLAEGFEVAGIDSINDYYDLKLKYARLSEHGIAADGLPRRGWVQSTRYPNYRFLQADLADHDFIVSLLKAEGFDYVVHLAAQAGVRYSLEHPRAYTHSNIDGFLSILEGCRHGRVRHLVYASSSSVYGLNTRMPLSEEQPTEHPISLYAATKKANEMMAHTYSQLFGLPTTGLRFFTVYGPWGRPDMALFLFVKAILAEEPIQVFNHGNMIRDFTYVADIVESICRLLPKPAQTDPDWSGEAPRIPTSSAPYRIYNIGNSSPVPISRYIEAIEAALGRKAVRNNREIQPGDVPVTHADVSALEAWVGFKPRTTIEEGIREFVKWYLETQPIGI
jgi:UDP-glucuronate 4-epimerase